ncbi:DUF4395 domain-containing protein [Rossellomorea sp. SC111]|uniref:DUF4395 domain-containing protein n=1 Tax=Rossellomorea sp. SC111 TaxID=2968985 RepID=UPI00215A726D|nr:DUF4395 domain-containing protein [Rossellomorea sp. SC111]MCR8847242.1 DUF4395 domain-containing protein [Rossellomorea sp. SC111]
MSSAPANSIPRPLVQLNQWFIVSTVATSWLFQIEFLLLLPFLVGMSALLFKYNPLMKAGRLFLKKETSSYPPEDAEQQRFNNIIAVSCLGGAIISFLTGWDTGVYLFSGMVFVAASVALAGFCIGCFIRFQWKRFQYKRSLQ